MLFELQPAIELVCIVINKMSNNIDIKLIIEMEKYSASRFCNALWTDEHLPLVRIAPIYDISEYTMKYPPSSNVRNKGLQYLIQYNAEYGSFRSEPIEKYLFKCMDTVLMELYFEQIYTSDYGHGYRQTLIYVFHNDLQALRTLEDDAFVGAFCRSSIDNLLRARWIDTETAMFLKEKCLHSFMCM